MKRQWLRVLVFVILATTLAFGLGVSLKYWSLDGFTLNWRFHLPFCLSWFAIFFFLIFGFVSVESGWRSSLGKRLLVAVTLAAVGLVLYDHAYGRGQYLIGAHQRHYAFWWWKYWF